MACSYGPGGQGFVGFGHRERQPGPAQAVTDLPAEGVTKDVAGDKAGRICVPQLAVAPLKQGVRLQNTIAVVLNLEVAGPEFFAVELAIHQRGDGDRIEFSLHLICFVVVNRRTEGIQCVPGNPLEANGLRGTKYTFTSVSLCTFRFGDGRFCGTQQCGTALVVVKIFDGLQGLLQHLQQIGGGGDQPRILLGVVL